MSNENEHENNNSEVVADHATTETSATDTDNAVVTDSDAREGDSEKVDHNSPQQPESEDATEKTDTSDYVEKQPEIVAKAKVDIDLSKYKYSPYTKDEYNRLEIPYSVYNAIGREELDGRIDFLTRAIEYNNLIMREGSIDAATRNELINQNKNFEKSLKPYLVVRESLSPGAFGIDCLIDEKSDIKRGISFGKEDRMVVGMPPKIDLSRASNPDIFLTVLSTALGSATEVRIPLPASGFTITINAPSTPEIIGMMSRIIRIEQRIARTTTGYTFSAQVSETISEIVRLFLAPERIKRCTLDVPFEEIRNYIKRADIDVLLGHFSWLMYPAGYNYVLDCLNYVDVKTGVDDEVREEPCGYIEKAEVNILDMIWYDNSRLTDAQRNMLAQSKHMPEDIERYQNISNETYLKEYSRIELIPENTSIDPSKKIDKIIIYLKSPNLDESLTLDDRWLIKLDRYIDQAGGNNLDQESLERLATDISGSMIVSMYTGYIDRIEMRYIDEGGQESSVVNNEIESISNALESISSNNDYADIIAIKINEYIEHIKIGFMGVPNKPCPKCNKAQPNEIVDMKLIPVNPLKDFFTVCRIKMR